MLTLTLWLLTAASPTPEVKLAAPGLTISGLDAQLAGPLTDHLARAFSGMRVVTPRDIAAILGLERQKELLGCGEQNASCMAELGNALGAQGVLLGDIVKLGDTIQINVRVIDPVNGGGLASASERVDSQDEIFDALTRAGVKLRAQVLSALHVSAPAGSAADVSLSSRPRSGLKKVSLIPIVAGGAAAVGGALCLYFADQSWQQLTSGGQGSLTQAKASGIASTGGTLQTAGGVLLAVGSAALVAGVVMLIISLMGAS